MSRPLTSVRLSAGMRALLDQVGGQSAALRTMIVLGAARLGLDLRDADVRRDLCHLLGEDLTAEAVGALREIYVGLAGEALPDTAHGVTVRRGHGSAEQMPGAEVMPDEPYGEAVFGAGIDV